MRLGSRRCKHVVRAFGCMPAGGSGSAVEEEPRMNFTGAKLLGTISRFYPPLTSIISASPQPSSPAFFRLSSRLQPPGQPDEEGLYQGEREPGSQAVGRLRLKSGRSNLG